MKVTKDFGNSILRSKIPLKELLRFRDHQVRGLVNKFLSAEGFNLYDYSVTLVKYTSSDEGLVIHFRTKQLELLDHTKLDYWKVTLFQENTKGDRIKELSSMDKEIAKVRKSLSIKESNLELARLDFRNTRGELDHLLMSRRKLSDLIYEIKLTDEQKSRYDAELASGRHKMYTKK